MGRFPLWHACYRARAVFFFCGGYIALSHRLPALFRPAMGCIVQHVFCIMNDIVFACHQAGHNPFCLKRMGGPYDMQQPINCLLPLTGIFNARELGGYATVDGRRTRTHRYLRAAATDHLTADDLAFLYDYGVRCVVDLRSHYEVETHPSRLQHFRDIAYYHVPMLDQMNSRRPEERDLPRPASADEVYRDLLLDSQAAFGQVLRIMAEHVQHCTLFHCTAGKDRTGLVAMLLLSIAGVDEATIARDYAASQTYLSSFTPARLRELSALGMQPLQYQYIPDPIHMQRALSLLRERFGSVHAYLLQAGLTDETLALLRRHMVA